MTLICIRKTHSHFRHGISRFKVIHENCTKFSKKWGKSFLKNTNCWSKKNLLSFKSYHQFADILLTQATYLATVDYWFAIAIHWCFSMTNAPKQKKRSTNNIASWWTDSFLISFSLFLHGNQIKNNFSSSHLYQEKRTVSSTPCHMCNPQHFDRKARRQPIIWLIW